MPTSWSRTACTYLLVVLAGCPGCDDPSVPLDAGEDATTDAGVIDCEADPLLPGCVPTERPAFAGLSAPVEIVRDADGVPHVYGANASDTMYGSGYAQAIDRLFQMDLARRRGLGRRAEVLGPSFVEGDSLVRLMDIPRWGRTNEAALFRDEPEEWALLQAWVEGVNARIDEVLAGEEPLPPEFTELGYQPERWALSDTLAFGKLVLFGNANQLEYTILAEILSQFMPEVERDLGLLIPFRDSYALPPEERPSGGSSGFFGPLPPPRMPTPDAADRIRAWQRRWADLRPGASNNWAMDGRHTENGRPLIAGDPHQPLQSPSLFWMHHMSAADGSLDVIGWNFVGGPTVSLGHNRHVAWTATTTYDDMMDVWQVRVTGGAAEVGGASIPIRQRAETIRVAGEAPVELMVEEVPGYGVLLPDDIAPLPIATRGRRLLFNWTGFRVTHEFSGIMDLDRASSLEAFEAAVDRIEIGSFNFVGADATGISYRVSPLVPDRGVPSDTRAPYLLLDGNDSMSLWDGTFLGRDVLPASRGGARGWIGTANNDPYGFIADGRIEGDPFYFGVFFDPGIRSARIEAELTRLAERGDVTLDDMEELQRDTYTLYADDYIPVLEEVWATRDTDALLASYRARPELDALVAQLAGWDRRMQRTASEPVVFNAFMFFLADQVLRDDLALVFDAILEAESAFILKWLSAALLGRARNAAGVFDEPRQVSVARALERTEVWLRERFPDGTYAWQDFHGTRLQSLYGTRLAAPWVPTDGACGTLNRADAVFFGPSGSPRDELESEDGSIYRMVASFGEDGTPEGHFAMAQGISGEPESPWWDHLHDDWVNGRYRPMRFSRAEVEADPVETTIVDRRP